MNSDSISVAAEQLREIFNRQMIKRFEVAASDAEHRIGKLKRILKWTLAHKNKIRRAIHDDFRKPEAEVDLTEIFAVTSELKHAMKHLKTWMKPRRVPPTPAMITSRAQIRYEPKGVVLIISPWNFPFNLTLGPVVSAIAAGNCCMVKPSEYTPRTSALIKEMMAELFPDDEVAVCEGDGEVAKQLLEFPFHHIFFTGSSSVGKQIMAAAAKHLSSVTLELGGKSPVIVDETANLNDAALKIVWGKFLNKGQTCIAPDYLFVHQSVAGEFSSQIVGQISRIYGENEDSQAANPDYARIISDRHHHRLKNILEEAREKGAQIISVGNTDAGARFILPTIVKNVPADSKLMQEEIFGPILPVNTYSDLNKVIEQINRGEKPLALYIFSGNKKNIDHIIQSTSSGGVCVNEVLLQFLHLNLPFGGINNSGFGKSHGYYGFIAMSNEKAVLRNIGISPLKLLYPPYTPRVRRLIELVIKYL